MFKSVFAILIFKLFLVTTQHDGQALLMTSLVNAQQSEPEKLLPAVTSQLIISVFHKQKSTKLSFSEIFSVRQKHDINRLCYGRLL